VKGERGIALLMVIWIFMILSVLSAEFSRAMRDDAIATQNLAEEIQARGVALAGMNRAIYRLLESRQNQTEDTDPNAVPVDTPPPWLPDGRWHEEPYWGGTYGVRMIDEGGRISLNRADEALLRKVFEAVGLDPKTQEEVTDAIIDWRDSDDLHRLHGAEDEYYMKLSEPYHAKNGPFDSVDELLQVRGITRELFFGTRDRTFGSKDTPAIPLRDVFSVFNRSANINVRTAPVAVLRVVLGGDEDAVEEIVTARDEDPSSVLGLIRAKVADQMLARRLVDRAPSRVAVEARATMKNGRVEARVGAVVYVPEDGDGFHIERWYDRLPAF
jgi:general secretion pathway protein K